MRKPKKGRFGFGHNETTLNTFYSNTGGEAGCEPQVSSECKMEGPLTFIFPLD